MITSGRQPSPTVSAQALGTADRQLGVCQLLHSADIGGVETAAGHLQQNPPSGIRYRIATLARRSDAAAPTAIKRPDYTGFGVNNPLSVWLLARWARRQNPDVVVASLWRSVIAGTLLRLVDRRIVFVVFLHNTRYKNLLDRVATITGMRLADAIFCDSSATLRALVPQQMVSDSYIIPLAAQSDIDRVVYRPQRQRLNLIFWGRLAPQKRIDRVLRLIAELAGRTCADRVHFTVVGPDAGELRSLRTMATDLGIDNNITWTGPKTWTEIVDLARHAAFFVQLSDFEGLGMAAAEAMRLGLVPVVTPVGQIASFAVDNHNSIHYGDARDTARRIIEIWNDAHRFRELSDAATKQWEAETDFRDAFAQACATAVTKARQ